MYSYVLHMENNLCTVTASTWKVPYVQLLAVYGQYLIYSYLQYMDSNFVQLLTVFGQYLIY